nr:retrotransposon protein, putative, Ty1-copia subclass [Tanacetum cinerariifolium]
MQKKDGTFISQDKYVVEILKKFGFTEVKTVSTPMETQKTLLKDEDDEEVDVHMYGSMIGSFMNLTSSRPDIMFAVYACARYQVNPKSFFGFFIQDKISRDMITVGSTMRIPLLYRGEYSQWREWFMNYLEEQTDGEAMINSIQNGDQPLHVIAQVSLAGNAQNVPFTLKDPKFWTGGEKKTQKIDRLTRSLWIQGLPNDIYSLIDRNETAKDLWDALERQMCGSEYGEQDRKAAILYDYETFKATEGEQFLDTY